MWPVYKIRSVTKVIIAENGTIYAQWKEPYSEITETFGIGGIEYYPSCRRIGSGIVTAKGEIISVISWGGDGSAGIWKMSYSGNRFTFSYDNNKGDTSSSYSGMTCYVTVTYRYKNDK